MHKRVTPKDPKPDIKINEVIMELFLVEVAGHKYHSYGNEESEDFKKNHLVKANSEGEAKAKAEEYYKSKSEPYGGYVYIVYAEVQDTIE